MPLKYIYNFENIYFDCSKLIIVSCDLEDSMEDACTVLT